MRLCPPPLRDYLRTRDFLGIGLLVLILGVSMWSVSILFSAAMRDMAIQRFHLGSDSFPTWAAHQTVPAMYNFENRIRFTNDLLGEAPFHTSHTNYRERTLNHFPGRYVTFGNNHFPCFSKQRQGTFELSTTFGDTNLTTRWEITTEPNTLNDSQSKSPSAPMTVRRISQQWNKVSGEALDE